MNDNNIDILIKEAIKKDIDGQVIPQGAKDRVVERLGLHDAKEEKRAKKRFYGPLVAAVLLGMFLIAGLVISQPATAINIKLLNRIQKIIGDKIYGISDSIGEEGVQTPATPPSDAKDNKLAKVQSELPFLMSTPNYLPPGLEVKDAKVTGGDKVKTVVIQYTGGEERMMVRVTGSVENADTTLAYDAEDGNAKEIIINGERGTLIEKSGGLNTVKWHDQGTVYNIIGSYPSDELIKIAENFSYTE